MIQTTTLMPTRYYKIACNSKDIEIVKSKVKILKLTLTKHWFNLHARGVKLIEYREVKKHWIHRLTKLWDVKAMCGIFKEFDEIWYYNGGHCGDKLPFCRRKWTGINIFSGEHHEPANKELLEKGKYYFGIFNGPVLETRNWKR